MFELLGRVVPRFRFLLVLAWLAAASVALLAPPLSSVSSADETSFLPKDAESLTARNVAARAFPADAAQATAEIVFERNGGLTDTDRQFIEGLKQPIESIDGVSRYVSPGAAQNQGTIVSGDKAMEMSVVSLNVPAFQEKANEAIDRVRELLRGAPSGLSAHVTGQAGIGRDYIQAIQQGTDSTTLVTVVLVVIVLLLIYRAPLAALVPLITIGLAFVVARGVLAFLGQHGFQLSSVVDSFIVVLVFGVGTDYTIFLISRFREELARAPLREATHLTIARIGAVITASAATVMVALSAMVVARFGMIQTIGPALALTIFITLLAGLTLTPSLLAILGRHLFWPFHPKMQPETEEEAKGAWAGLARAISSHAGLISIVVLVALAGPLLALPQLKQSFDVPSELPAEADSRLGFDTIGNHVGKGELLRMTVLVQVPGADLSKPDSLKQIQALQGRLLTVVNGGTVSSAVAPAGDGTTLAALRPGDQLATMADSFKAAPSSDINVQLGDASLNGIRSAQQYVGGLKTAFPSADESGRLSSAIQDLADIEQGLVQMRQQALVANQLTGIADRLQLASTAPASADTAKQLAQLKTYLDELAVAYPDARQQDSYKTAQASIQALQKSRDANAYIQLVGSIRQLSKWFGAMPSPAYFAPKNVTQTADLTALTQRVTAARSRLPAELTAVAGTFAPDALYMPPASTGTPGASSAASSSAGSIDTLRASFFSSSGDVTRLFVTTATDPYATASFATVGDIRAALASFRTSDMPNAQFYLGGATAEFADIQRTINEDFVLVAIVTVVGILLVLLVLLRSIVAPIYLVATVLLSYGTSLSLSALILQRGFNQGGINYFIPLMVFVLLVALGSDYNIFLMSRIREEAANLGLRPGLRVASARTGTVITSAGLILAGTFGALISSPLQLLFQVGIAVALGVLLDTFIVRSLLVPALTTVAGEAAWWPSRMRQKVAAPPAAPLTVSAVLAQRATAQSAARASAELASIANEDAESTRPRTALPAYGAAVAGTRTDDGVLPREEPEVERAEVPGSVATAEREGEPVDTSRPVGRDAGAPESAAEAMTFEPSAVQLMPEPQAVEPSAPGPVEPSAPEPVEPSAREPVEPSAPEPAEPLANTEAPAVEAVPAAPALDSGVLARPAPRLVDAPPAEAPRSRSVVGAAASKVVGSVFRPKRRG